MDKLNVARRQLGMASSIFIEDLDPVSVHTLVCASREIIERICEANASPSILTTLAVNANRSIKDLRRLANQYGRALKHNNPKSQDDYWLQNFSDQQNDFLLFIAWHDYAELTGKMPLEAQVIYTWVEALYPEKMLYQKDFSSIPPLSGLTTLDRREQKKRLMDAVAFARQMPQLVGNQRTEFLALVFR